MTRAWAESMRSEPAHEFRNSSWNTSGPTRLAKTDRDRARLIDREPTPPPPLEEPWSPPPPRFYGGKSFAEGGCGRMRDPCAGLPTVWKPTLGAPKWKKSAAHKSRARKLGQDTSVSLPPVKFNSRDSTFTKPFMDMKSTTVAALRA
jgi:hypothetical protein